MYSFSRDFKNSPKKKKRKYSVDNNAISTNINQQSTSSSRFGHHNSSLSINIIDRVLDLSKYNQKTGLYTLSRAWINATTSLNSDTTTFNHKSSDLINKNFSTSDNITDDFYVTSLPEPDKQETNNSDKIKKLNENIEVNIRSNEKADMDIIDSLSLSSDDYLMQTHALLKLHVNRWKSARKEWLNYYKKSNEAYKKSYNVLKGIYEDV